jgi:hypothetical protein
MDYPPEIWLGALVCLLILAISAYNYFYGPKDDL